MVHLCMLLAFSSAVIKMWKLILVAADVRGQTCFAKCYLSKHASWLLLVVMVVFLVMQTIIIEE